MEKTLTIWPLSASEVFMESNGWVNLIQKPI